MQSGLGGCRAVVTFGDCDIPGLSVLECLRSSCRRDFLAEVVVVWDHREGEVNLQAEISCARPPADMKRIKNTRNSDISEWIRLAMTEERKIVRGGTKRTGISIITDDKRLRINPHCAGIFVSELESFYRSCIGFRCVWMSDWMTLAGP